MNTKLEAIYESLKHNFTEEELFVIEPFISHFKHQRSGEVYLKTLTKFRMIIGKSLFEVDDKECSSYFHNIDIHYGNKVPETTKERIYFEIRSFFEYCLENRVDKVKVNPLNRVRKPIAIKTISEKKLLSHEDADNLITAIKNLPHFRDTCALLFIFSTGLKISQVINADWSDFGLDSKGNVAFKLVEQGFERYIFILPDMWEMLLTYRENLSKGRVVPPNDFTPLFVNKSNGRIGETTIREALYSACDSAKIERCSPSDLRHTFAKYALDSGVSAEKLGETLGWSDKSLANRYPKANPYTEDAVANYIHFNLKGKRE